MSGFEDDAEVVREAAARLFGHHNHPGGVRPEDVKINEGLLRVNEAITFEATRQKTGAFFSSLGLAPTANYIERFRSAYISSAQGAALRREQVKVCDVAQLVADDVEESITGKRPKRETALQGERPLPVVQLSSDQTAIKSGGTVMLIAACAVKA